MGDCFERAYWTLEELSQQDTHDEPLLCHGAVTNTGEAPGARMGHAWVEIGSIVFEYVEGGKVALTRDMYYDVGQIDPDGVVRYTLGQSRELLARNGHFGPWDPSLDGLAYR